ncbi:hypothetical protein A3H90_00565 [Candidatus Peribacteria bacterium RIFCSPLOWO2_02_FULL_55_36]|nr:MAG: hypothetical protein A2789_01230 [Candidatus Peribacteria bacterium RIFCSPHIGHO2_01_FULL_54_22]OGJ63121.1 MAG: hypothetical protein A3D12_02775 [Candidatus Peribacteria bacterium RIFCSPHIGHO2_02_FULL_55_24]OGJ64407.1 MAG: hypothetical protein A3E47_02870 [Candidatus Peribacteria bacterium RIFCSPHIGHO2_12_FULL_54_10]OGJ67669.1 MAG: hypothetical protein A2947_00740 [Candidatus Peribacteria bacterium RIFCSPLOWO2_01_FULL_54_110]OGJ70183.1 MAG: hypothetical protein A3H90_00565 [Candidatus Pe
MAIYSTCCIGSIAIPRPLVALLSDVNLPISAETREYLAFLTRERRLRIKGSGITLLSQKCLHDPIATDPNLKEAVIRAAVEIHPVSIACSSEVLHERRRVALFSVIDDPIPTQGRPSIALIIVTGIIARWISSIPIAVTTRIGAIGGCIQIIIDGIGTLRKIGGT